MLRTKEIWGDQKYRNKETMNLNKKYREKIERKKRNNDTQKKKTKKS